jgi:hypothetical protein
MAWICNNGSIAQQRPRAQYRGLQRIEPIQLEAPAGVRYPHRS